MIVVKVGGSLFDHPALGVGLRAFVESLAPKEVLLVPGGGPLADAVRALDRTHTLGEEASHWLALRALSVTGEMLRRMLEEPTPPVPFPSLREGGVRTAPPALPSLFGKGVGGLGHSHLLDPFSFALEDESRPSALPHSWSVTTDSIAARVAGVFRAERLILLKSTDIPPGISWVEVASRGWVDAHFPQVVATLACPVEAVNFRRELDARL
ncbi:MAG: hypothetical protein L0241_10560 [Planctomycetia bacterium]|nr:hypothetical protein [Planctomycetia bacterium]